MSARCVYRSEVTSMPTRLGMVAAAATFTLALPVVSASAGDATPGAGLHPGKESFLAPPPEGPFPGPMPINRPSCKPGQIEAVAFTQSSPDGVLGVVELEGTKFYHVKHFGYRRCKLLIGQGPRGFIAANGEPLAVPRGRADTTNRANDSFSYLDLANGKAAWGFGWFGSYCGDAPRYIVMKLKGRRGTLDVPLDGPTPACPTDPVEPVTSTLTDGTAGGPGSAVQPAPPSYLNLTTSARFLGTTTHRHPAPVEVTISDTSAQPVDLMPCPLYEVQTDAHTGKHPHFGSAVIDGSTPGCKKTDLTVRPDQPVTFRVTRKELSPGTHFNAPPDSTFDVQVELPGIPTAKVSTTVK
jgi:hypothetical protein